MKFSHHEMAIFNCMITRVFLALIDTRTERVWFEQNQELYSLKDTINQTYAKNSFVHEDD